MRIGPRKSKAEGAKHPGQSSRARATIAKKGKGRAASGGKAEGSSSDAGMAGQPTIASFFAPAPGRDHRKEAPTTTRPSSGNAGANKAKRAVGIGIGLKAQAPSDVSGKKRKEAPKPNAKSAAGSARPAELKGFELAAEKPAPEVPKAAEVVVAEEVAEDPPKTAACKELAGKRIRVWWSAEKEWFAGTVGAASRAGDKVRVDYDDGDVEWVVLAKRKHEFVGEDPALQTDEALEEAKEKTKSRASKRRRMTLIAEDDDDDDGMEDSLSEEDLGSDSDYCGDGGEGASEDDDEDGDDDDESMEEAEPVDVDGARKQKRRAAPKKSNKGLRLGASPGTPSQPILSQQSNQTSAAVPAASSPAAHAAHAPRSPLTGREKARAAKKLAAAADGGGSGGRNFEERAHQRFKFLRPENIKDASGRRKGDPLYDASTLHIPAGWFKQEKVSPGQQQWWTFKSENFDSVLLFKMGKFYEMYEMDAHVGVEHLGLLYMKGDQPHCGFPEKAYASNAEKLARKGFKVIVVEQTETPEQLAERNRKRKKAGMGVDKVVNREKVAVLSPGTLFDYEMVRNTRGCSYIVAVAEGGDFQIGVSAVDVTTGKMILGQLADNASRSKLTTFLAAINPVEVVVPKGGGSEEDASVTEDTRAMLRRALPGAKLTELIPGDQFWAGGRALEEASGYFEGGALPETLRELRDKGAAIALSALGGIVSFLQRSLLDKAVLPVCQFEVLPEDGIPRLADDEQGARLDASALSNLEIVENAEGSKEGTLLSQLDHCVSGPGHRLLREWLLHPLRKVESIVARQRAVEELRQSGLADDFHAGLKGIPDLERSLTRMAASSVGSGRERDGVVLYEDSCGRRLRAFLATLRGFKKLQILLVRLESERRWESTLLARLLSSLEWAELESLETKFDWVKAERDGQVTPVGFPQYDDAVAKIEEVGEEVQAYLDEVWSKVRGKGTFTGEEMEVAEKTDVPTDWELTSQRKGKGAVRRYQTRELREILQRRTMAEEQKERALREYLRSLVAGFCRHHENFQRAVEVSAQIDVLCSLSMVGDGWCQPNFVEADRGTFRAKALSHPNSGADFVPNDLDLGGEKSFALLTGPNMGGKSTIMRQVCLATILAQIGAPVPARSCELTPVDAIFVRMGARDSIFTGQSTWNVELSDCNSMLQQATPHSLVVLDEFGRGTAISDGIALAAAVMRWLVNRRCLSLFSTHYHLLAQEAGEDVMLWHMACEVDEKDDVTFLYKIRQGVCPSSYGVNVARLAGLPAGVLNRASEVIKMNE